MNEMARWSGQAIPIVERGRPSSISPLFGVVSAVATGLVALAGFMLALVFAATLAVVMVMAAALFALAALAWRVRPRPATVQAHRAGHAWVAYDWEDRQR